MGKSRRTADSDVPPVYVPFVASLPYDQSLPNAFRDFPQHHGFAWPNLTLLKTGSLATPEAVADLM